MEWVETKNICMHITFGDYGGGSSCNDKSMNLQGIVMNYECGEGMNQRGTGQKDMSAAGDWA